MAALEGSVKTPLGPVQKKTALYVVFGVSILGGIVWYRHKQTAATTPVDSTATDAEIDPATGFPYGSAEDAAALASQAAYITPADNSTSTGGSSSIPPTGTGYASNGAWTQGVVQYMTSNGLIEDPTALSAALGVYATGSYATDAQASLIDQAIAAQGYPPVAGPSGYPPSINRNPPQTGGGTTTPTVGDLPAPTGFHASRIDKDGVSLDWNPVAGAIGYKIYVNGKQYGNTVTYSNSYVYDLKSGTHYNLGVFPVNSKGAIKKYSQISVTTKK